jgi:hypothetical protein
MRDVLRFAHSQKVMLIHSAHPRVGGDEFLDKFG